MGDNVKEERKKERETALSEIIDQRAGSLISREFAFPQAAFGSPPSFRRPSWDALQEPGKRNSRLMASANLRFH